ncbi:MAG: tRNA (adenosine(37)-N6)-threonylcarbamoyltransferase complex transferase subunit TsaD [Candidatus Omnitrophica bacterium]|nr:tRNA (adenosine(37)-N6)-threonylcarbamoyltransferase complex transferase subunit TsaD [Candidatus Omnitrophota bacterium]MBU2044255.1 tRNA (adenosine(37)-N6)-threonylcarbamoyltransferase complex transferase subunit TsaD [Candidatus Omnitrophota bacterium]MBU2251519.1 tRNA (adenosine(37)-N6)-threonylcarbamoyltransferase complex transferase subunit TsaD [Candidatus Omnitrophota bacterium]MBU2266076.1 tRNA (adenosine(37)-N6)-threonylcarbamoyltransferase complex transferase subunit TsaD [Candidat
MYTLGIETSCDETSCAVLKGYRVLSNVTLSSLREHKKYGGVIPEIATRAHLVNIDQVTRLALEESGLSLAKIGLISVTAKPGLIGALVVGLNFAKALSFALKKPFIGVDHLLAHLFAPFLDHQETLKFPFLGVVISGGHTEIYRVDDFNKVKMIGATRDDACGEVFDKVAVSYGLGYPGGPQIDKLFNPAYCRDFKFKCGRIGFDLSFSGIKTALMYKKIEFEKKGTVDGRLRQRLISSFQHTVFETVVSTIQEAAEKLKIKTIVCGGGVLANNYLRRLLKAKEKQGLKMLITPRQFSGDNAAIVAGLGFYLYNKRGLSSSFRLEAGAS